MHHPVSLPPSTPFLYGTGQRLSFVAIWLAWTAIHVWLLMLSGMPFDPAWKQGLAHNGLLLGAALMLVTITRFYLPARKRLLRMSVLLLSIWIGWMVSLEGIAEVPGLGTTSGDANRTSAAQVIRGLSGLIFLVGITLVNIVWNDGLLRQADEWQRRESERRLKEAELLHLRAQLNPHFLFNSLNSIHTLIGKDAPMARQMTIQLADFLRGTLRLGDQPWTSLEEEIRQMERYLSIEKCRFGDRLKLSLEMSPGTEAGRLPALILQPLVENALKYGLDSGTGPVELILSSGWADRMLQVILKNRVSDQDVSPGNGFGLEYIERRMFLLFGRSGLITRQQISDQFIITLNIPQIA